jgi:large subunit ribosomal protein L21
MYAVIESGGKQHRVELGSEIQVDRLDVQPGDSITLDRVLLVADGDDAAIGQPVVDGASVSAQVLRQERGEKIVVFKYKPKARTRVKQGFRAELTTLRITDIAFAGRSAAKDAESAEKAEAKKAREAAAAEKAAAEKAAAEKAAADKALAEKLAAAAEAEAKASSKKSASKSGAKAAEAAPAPAPAGELATADAEPAAADAEPAAADGEDATADAEPATADAEDTRKDG